MTPRFQIEVVRTGVCADLRADVSATSAVSSCGATAPRPGTVLPATRRRFLGGVRRRGAGFVVRLVDVRNGGSPVQSDPRTLTAAAVRALGAATVWSTGECAVLCPDLGPATDRREAGAPHAGSHGPHQHETDGATPAGGGTGFSGREVDAVPSGDVNCSTVPAEVESCRRAAADEQPSHQHP